MKRGRSNAGEAIASLATCDEGRARSFGAAAIRGYLATRSAPQRDEVLLVSELANGLVKFAVIARSKARWILGSSARRLDELFVPIGSFVAIIHAADAILLEVTSASGFTRGGTA